jgi:ABC-type multidrug transport system fused ATPase/permease subunit
MGSGPHSGWPHKGAIEIRDLEIKYAPDLPSILKGISLTIPPGAKVGILGRTGSGKSTLASSFFRFVEPSRGQILIDDVDLTSLGLEQLRSKLTIVPQDPVILSGTLREALDPFQEHSDEEVTAALKSAYLIPSDEAQAAKSNFSDLSYAIAEGGSNLSGGQRQLLCLGRALLQRSRVVFL